MAVWVCMCVYLACNKSFTRNRVQRSNKLNAIRAASRRFRAEYVLLSLFHFDGWKMTTLFIIIKGSTGHKKVQSKWGSHATIKALAWVTRWHLKSVCVTDVRAACLCLSAQFCAVEPELTAAKQSTGTDQQVISISLGRYLKRAHWNVEIIPPAIPHLSPQNNNNKKKK